MFLIFVDIEQEHLLPDDDDHHHQGVNVPIYEVIECFLFC